MKGDILDLRRIYHEEYTAADTPRLVRCLKGRYLSASGGGPLWTDAFRRRRDLLQLVLHTLEKSQARAGRPFRPGPLEIILPVGRKEGTAVSSPGENLEWKLLVRIPTAVGEHERLDAVMQLLESDADPAVSEVRQEILKEGLSVQVVHAPGCAELEPALHLIHDFASRQNLELADSVHLIYLNDPPAGEEHSRPVLVRIPLAKEPAGKSGK